MIWSLIYKKIKVHHLVFQKLINHMMIIKIKKLELERSVECVKTSIKVKIDTLNKKMLCIRKQGADMTSMKWLIYHILRCLTFFYI